MAPAELVGAAAKRNIPSEAVVDIGTRAAELVRDGLKGVSPLGPEVARMVELIVSVSAETDRVALVSRALKAVAAAVSAPMNAADEAQALSASTDMGALAMVLTSAAADPAVSRLDPKAELIAAGAVRKAELLQQAGGVFGSGEAASVLGITRQAVEKRRKAGTIIAVPAGDDFRYPACQFDANGMVPGLDAILREMPIRSNWMRLEWLLTADDALGGASPLDALRLGRKAEVLEVARSHGAD